MSSVLPYIVAIGCFAIGGLATLHFVFIYAPDTIKMISAHNMSVFKFEDFSSHTSYIYDGCCSSNGFSYFLLSGRGYYSDSTVDVVGNTIIDDHYKKRKLIIKAFEQRGWKLIDFSKNISASGQQISIKKIVPQKGFFGQDITVTDSDGDTYILYEEKEAIIKYPTYHNHSYFTFERDLNDLSLEKVAELESIEYVIKKILEKIWEKYNHWYKHANKNRENQIHQMRKQEELEKVRRNGKYPWYEKLLVALSIISGLFGGGVLLVTSVIKLITMIFLNEEVSSHIYIGITYEVRIACSIALGLCALLVVLFFVIDKVRLKAKYKIDKFVKYHPDKVLMHELNKYIDMAQKYYKKLRIRRISLNGKKNQYLEAPVSLRGKPL